MLLQQRVWRHNAVSPFTRSVWLGRGDERTEVMSVTSCVRVNGSNKRRRQRIKWPRPPEEQEEEGAMRDGGEDDGEGGGGVLRHRSGMLHSDIQEK